MMPQRRRMMASSQNGRFWIYKDGTTAKGYSFSASGYYGASSSSYGTDGTDMGFKSTGAYMQARCYDGTTSAAYGCGFCETSGIERSLLSEYKTVNFEVCRDNGTLESASSGIANRAVGVYSSDKPSASTAIVSTGTITEITPTVYSFKVSDILDESSAGVFYLGGGVRTVVASSPGYCTLRVSRIWLA